MHSSQFTRSAGWLVYQNTWFWLILFYMSESGWGEGQLEKAAWGWGRCYGGGCSVGRARTRQQAYRRTACALATVRRKTGQGARRWRVGEGTGSPKPGQGEMCFSNTSPAAGARQRELQAYARGRGRGKNRGRKPWESTWGSAGVRGEDPEGKGRGQKWREAKGKRGLRELSTIGQLLSQSGSCDRTTSAFWSS